MLSYATTDISDGNETKVYKTKPVLQDHDQSYRVTPF